MDYLLRHPNTDWDVDLPTEAFKHLGIGDWDVDQMEYLLRHPNTLAIGCGPDGVPSEASKHLARCGQDGVPTEASKHIGDWDVDQMEYLGCGPDGVRHLLRHPNTLVIGMWTRWSTY